MVRRWSGPYTYQGAVEHIKKCQTGRTSLNIEPYYKLVMLDDSVMLTSGWMNYAQYYPDNTVRLFPKGGTAQEEYLRLVEREPQVYVGWNPFAISRHEVNVVVKYTPVVGVKRIRWKSHETTLPSWGIPSGEHTPIKKQRCRKCRGYKWQGEETEDVLFNLAEPKPGYEGVTKHSYVWYMSEEQKLHAWPCTRCSGTGKADYGGNPLCVPIERDTLIGADGKPLPASLREGLELVPSLERFWRG